MITGCIFKGAGSKFLEGITGSANKAAYMFTDIERSAKYFKIPLRYVPARVNKFDSPISNIKVFLTCEQSFPLIQNP